MLVHSYNSLPCCHFIVSVPSWSHCLWNSLLLTSFSDVTTYLTWKNNGVGVSLSLEGRYSRRLSFFHVGESINLMQMRMATSASPIVGPNSIHCLRLRPTTIHSDHLLLSEPAVILTLSSCPTTGHAIVVPSSSCYMHSSFWSLLARKQIAVY